MTNEQGQAQVQNPVEPVQAPADTSVQQATPPTNAGGNGENLNGGESTSASATDTTQKDEIARRREEGKLKQVQDQLKAAQERAEALATYLASDENLYKQALVRMQGLNEAQAEAKIAEIKAQNPGIWGSVVQQANYGGQQTPDINVVLNQHPALQRVNQYLQEQDNAFYMQFEADKPELTGNPDADAWRQKIAKDVEDLKTFPQYATLSRRELFEVAYKGVKPHLASITEDQAEALKLQGMAAANNDRATNIVGGVSSSSVDGKSKTALPEHLKRYADAAGMSYEEYAEEYYKRNK